MMDSLSLAQIIAQEVLDTKGQDLKILDLRNLVSYTDYFVLVTGTSDRHVQAMADRINVKLKKEFGLLPLTFEGYALGQWVLLDYGDVVVHLFQPEARAFYALEEFWQDAPLLALPEELEKQKSARDRAKKRTRH